ncbi:unnamed protein product [Meganyctiphanes norvegica]|uniref:Uncharacterized protein n=1 Tax=Meganyctiphanes norvegica TaxID=48144 RepID=A0AAV2SQA7_MEGNR
MKAWAVFALFLLLSLVSRSLEQSFSDEMYNQINNAANQQTTYHHQRNNPSILQTALRFGLLSGLQGSGGRFGQGNKGLQYFMHQYGPLTQVLAEDVMDTVGISRNIKMAIPMVLKLLSLTMYLLMNVNSEFRNLQPTVKIFYEFLQNFNKPQTSVYNEVTDQVFTALDRSLTNGNYLFQY